jgi:hypothetical protein
VFASCSSVAARCYLVFGRGIIVAMAPVGDCCVLVVGCVQRRNMLGDVPCDRRYPSDEVTMSILVGIRAIGVAASTPNWLVCRVVRATTSLWNDAWWRLRQNRRNKTRRRVFLHDGTSRIDRSWRSPLSYGHDGASLPAFKHATISQHTMQQVYVVKTRKTIINNVY